MTWTPPTRPSWVERLVAHGRLIGGAEQLVSLDPEELIRTAVESTGLDDFGDDAWREHYAVLMDALENESKLHLLGRILARHEALRCLRNRLKLTALWKEEPDILDTPLPSPVFVVGSARSGTSILHELLACDPASRAPAMWEMLHPVEACAGDALRADVHETELFWHEVQPEYETMHANSGELPNECIYIVMNEFLSDQWGGCHAIPSYGAHLVTADHHGAYAFHRRFLQTLSLRAAGERWLLKAPSHLFQLRTLFDLYPDARIVHTHRDPARTVPSTINLMGTLKWMRCEEVDMGETIRSLPAGQAYAFRREIEQRADGTLPDDRFVDVLYADLMRDPIEAVEGIYARLGWSLASDVRRSMADYIAHRPRGKHGVHRYSLEQFGLDPDRERERFAFYRERFGVPEESGP